MVDYHHIVPWAVEQHNRVEDMVVLCPAHHDECSKGAILEAEQRQWKATPRNVAQGYADGLLKINHSYCALDCGSCLLVNAGVHFIVDGEPLLKLVVHDGRVAISMNLYDETGQVLAIIEDNDWVSGDSSLWDMEAGYQHLVIRRGPREVILDINTRPAPMMIRACLWKDGHQIDIGPRGLFLRGEEMESSLHELCLVGLHVEVDTHAGKWSVVPDPRFGQGVIVSEGDRLERFRKGVNALSGLRAGH